VYTTIYADIRTTIRHEIRSVDLVAPTVSRGPTFPKSFLCIVLLNHETKSSDESIIGREVYGAIAHRGRSLISTTVPCYYFVVISNIMSYITNYELLR